ncbi:MAG: hypothetical protein R3C45_20185 [Phycisphaerales bacterium]
MISTTGLVTPDPTTTGAGDTLYIGYTADGTMSIDNGSKVSASTSYIGNSRNVTGTTSIDGQGSNFITYGNLTVGRSGTGSLNLQNLATVEADNLYLGDSASGSGSLTIDGHVTSARVYNTLYVGKNGSGTLAVNNGGDAVTNYGIVGDRPNSTGAATVDGAGSFWNLIDLAIGREGNGTLGISNVGRVETSYMAVGSHATSNGAVTIDGTDTLLFTTQLFQVGVGGSGSLTITNGGHATSNNAAEIGVMSGSTGTATVDGSESRWYLNSLHVGIEGSGTLNIRNDAVVQSTSVRVGSASAADGRIILDGGILDVFEELKTSPQDLLGTGTVNADGIASDIDLLFDSTHGAQQQIILNSEPDQNVTINLDLGSGRRLGAGYRGNGTLTITEGVTVESGEGLLGDLVGSSGTAVVSGAATTWQNNDGIIVGNEGTGVLSIQGGATVVLDDDLIIANAPTATGTVNLIDGTLDLAGNYMLIMQGNGVFNFTGGKLKDARIINVSLHQQGGTLAPGNVIGLGTSLIEGDYTLTDGTLEMQIGGSASNEYDRLEVSGIATLGGALHVSLVNGFVPSPGDSFGFLFAEGGFGGNFSELILPDLSPYGLDWMLNPGGSTLFLNVVDAAIPGDLDGDGFVGIGDLNIVLSNWNQNVTPGQRLLGDPTGDGFVGIEDLNTVLGDWNAGTPPAEQNIPEPAGLFAMALAASAMRRTR